MLVLSNPRHLLPEKLSHLRQTSEGIFVAVPGGVLL